MLQRNRICKFHSTIDCLEWPLPAPSQAGDRSNAGASASIPPTATTLQKVRWCQQCGKFQAIGEFDGIKRTCRERLSKHNAARRHRERQTAAGGANTRKKKQQCASPALSNELASTFSLPTEMPSFHNVENTGLEGPAVDFNTMARTFSAPIMTQAHLQRFSNSTMRMTENDFWQLADEMLTLL